ncbi:MAG: nucleotide exchange factor GrpE [bacterium]|nr:nucleotide exchange factor GrpE [bacterium]
MDEESDDIIIDSESDIDDSVIADDAKEDAIKKLKLKLRTAEEKAREHLDGWQRAQADFINIRKRDEEAKIRFLKFAKSDVLSELLPILDSFNSAIAHGQKEVEPIYNQFMQVLKNQGLTELNPIGEDFNPQFHEAVGSLATENKEEDHKILEVFQKGYLLGERVLKPAKVRVGEFKE